MRIGVILMENKSNEKVREERVPMNVTLSPDNKKFLKMYAVEHGTTVSQVITDYVEKLKKDDGK